MLMAFSDALRFNNIFRVIILAFFPMFRNRPCYGYSAIVLLSDYYFLLFFLFRNGCWYGSSSGVSGLRNVEKSRQRCRE